MDDTQNQFILPLAVIIAGGLIAWGFFATKDEPAPDVAGTPDTDIIVEDAGIISVNSEDHILGNPNAEVTIITYSDFECSYCKTFHFTMNQIVDNLGKDGKISWVMRHFPVHGYAAQMKALATECAARLGGENKFWEMTEKAFEIKDNNWITAEDLDTAAESIGIDKEDFNSCLAIEASPEKAKVGFDFQSGIDQEFDGTPYSVIINNSTKQIYPLNGAQSYENVKMMIESILEEQ